MVFCSRNVHWPPPDHYFLFRLLHTFTNCQSNVLVKEVGPGLNWAAVIYIFCPLVCLSGPWMVTANIPYLFFLLWYFWSRKEILVFCTPATICPIFAADRNFAKKMGKKIKLAIFFYSCVHLNQVYRRQHPLRLKDELDRIWLLFYLFI